MASMIPYRSVFGIRPTSLFDAFDDMMDMASAPLAKAFPIDVEDTGTGYEVKAYLTGVSKDEIDVELNEGRLSISVNVEEKEEDKNKNYLQKEFTSYSATRGVYLKDAASEGLSARFADGVLTVTVQRHEDLHRLTAVTPACTADLTARRTNLQRKTSLEFPPGSFFVSSMAAPPTKTKAFR